MEIAEHVVQLYQRLATVCAGRAQHEPAAQDRVEELLAQAENSARIAPGPKEREAYETFLLAAALAFQKPARAVPVLEQSESDQPRDGRPALQLARAYAAAGRFDDAMAACDRALWKSQGVAQLPVYTAREQIQRWMGDEEGARQTLLDSKRFASTLPDAAARPAVARME